MEAAVLAIAALAGIALAVVEDLKRREMHFRCTRCGITWDGRDKDLIMRIATVHDCVKQSAHNTI